MAITDWIDIDAEKGGTLDEQGLRDYDRHFVARCNSANDAEPVIFAHPRCPKILQTYAKWDNNAICVGVDARYRKKTRYLWDVKCKFTTKQLQPPNKDDPLQDPIEVETTTDIVLKERFADRGGNPYVNTAGDLIKVMRRVPELVISVTKNVPVTNSWLKDLQGIINDGPVFIEEDLYPAYTLTVSKIHLGKKQWRNKKPFKVCQMELRYDPDGWVAPSLNVGFNELVPDPFGAVDKKGKPLLIKQRCLNDKNEPESEPCFLDKNGMRPRETYLHNFVEKSRPKTILKPKEIIVLNLDQMDLFNFGNLPLK